MSFPKIVNRYRITWRDISRTIHYANKDADHPLPRVRWSPSVIEYPDHFTMAEVRKILAFYSDQKLSYYAIKIQVNPNDT